MTQETPGPARVPHPSEYIQEEMDERGWDRDRLATAMMAADDDNWGIWRLAIDFYFEVGPTERNLRLDPEAFARAFGVSPELFINLEAAWLNQ